MVTEVDHHAIKTRIMNILKDDTNTYDSTGSPNKLVDIFVGRPYANNLSAHPTPFCFIANEDNLEEQEPEAVVENNAVQATKHECFYLICMVDDAQDGREVEKLYNGSHMPGYHTITWDASEYSNGIYFVMMVAQQLKGGQTGKYVKTQKLMLIK